MCVIAYIMETKKHAGDCKNRKKIDNVCFESKAKIQKWESDMMESGIPLQSGKKSCLCTQPYLVLNGCQFAQMTHFCSGELFYVQSGQFGELTLNPNDNRNYFLQIFSDATI
jgi:hypothetical protein